MNKKNIIPYAALGILSVYFLSVVASVVGLAVKGTSFTAAVIALELATVLSTPVLLLLFMTIPTESKDEKQIAKKLSIIFMTCCMVLTSAAHFMNLAFIMPLMNSGVNIPIYLQIGQWPSALMAIDYLGWGFFMGAAFLASSFSVTKKNPALKYTLLVCGILCLMGLVGTVLVHANFWYIASLGYGIGTAIVCIELIILNKSQGTK